MIGGEGRVKTEEMVASNDWNGKRMGQGRDFLGVYCQYLLSISFEINDSQKCGSKLNLKYTSKQVENINISQLIISVVIFLGCILYYNISRNLF